MNSSNCSPLLVREMFRSLLANTASATAQQRLSTTPQQRLSATAQQRLSTTPQQRLSATTTPSEPLILPPPKNSIRFIENDQNDRREKYDGHRWRLVCTWNLNQCTNLAHSHQLCGKHNALRRHKELPKRKRKPLITHSSLPIISQYNNNNNNNDDDDDDDDDIEILEDYCKSPITRHSMNNNVKTEMPDFNVFSVEHVNDTDLFNNIKSEPMASSSSRSTRTATNDIEYLSSKTRSNGLNIDELMSKNIPPLTDFEEEFLATRLMQKFSTTCSMLDAQLFLHNEAIAVVRQNYRLKMDSVAPEYFYDFLLRHPRVALHYSNWFLRCKPVPPTTGCPIDTKVWTLSMIVRGATASDNMIDEYNG